MTTTYPLAKHGVFRTIQGEGSTLGVPMVFVRLAGCSVGCAQCDTDYKVHHRLSAAEIGKEVRAVRGSSNWIWVTGGEPTDHYLTPLLQELKLLGKVALATSGVKSYGSDRELVDFLSVSPHGTPSKLVLNIGDQINLVPGLNGLDLQDWIHFDASGFDSRYVTPLWYDPANRAERIGECVKFVESRPGWRLGVQAHKSWGLA